MKLVIDMWTFVTSMTRVGLRCDYTRNPTGAIACSD